MGKPMPVDNDEACRLARENEDLRTRLNLIEDAIENVRHGLCVFAPDGTIAFCNRRYPEVIGLPPKMVGAGLPVRELIGMGREAGFYPGRTLEEVEREFWRNLSSEQTTHGEIQRSGRTYVVHPGRTSAGNLVATFEDVTTQRAAEDSIRQGEARLSRMLDSMPDCIKIFDQSAKLTYINSRGLELLEALDLHSLEESGHIPVPPEYMPEAIDVHKRVIAGESIVWSYELIGLKGTRRRVEAHAVPFLLPDGAPAHLSITRDVTERKASEYALRRSEERLRLIQEASGLADFENDCGEVTHCSDRFFEQVGLPVGDNTITIWQWLNLVHPEDRDSLREEMERTITERVDVFDAEYRIVRPDNGEVRWISCRTKILRDDDGTALRTIGAHRDITNRKLAEIALRENEERLRLVQEATGLAGFWAGPDGLTHVSETLIEQLGLPDGTDTLPFKELLNYIHPDDRDHVTRKIQASLQANDTFSCEFRIIHGHTGEVRWIHSRTKVDRDESGNALRSIGAHLDITDRKRAEEALRESEERFRLAAEAAGLGVWDYDPVSDTREWSNRLLEIFGLAVNIEPTRELAAEQIHAEDRSRFLAMLDNALDSQISAKFEDSFRIIRASDCAERWIAVNCWKNRQGQSGACRIILTLRDVTDEKTAEERIRWSATHDELTRLSNRTAFQEKLERAVEAGEKTIKPLGLLLLDLDHFKQINDTLGHDAGDRLLKMFADRLNSVVRPGDLVARLGGDEFAIIISDLKDCERMMELSASIHERLRDPFVDKGRILDCRASIGGALFPRDGKTSEDLMKSADMALYAAKNAGRSTTTIFRPELREAMHRRTDMIHIAREAIQDHRILSYYQPKIDLRSGNVVGFEALMRLRAPGGQINLPERFEAAFEDLEVAAALSDRMIQHAITDMRNWLDAGIDFGHLAVNASAAEFRRDDFAERVLEQLERAEIPTSRFQIEVTETVFLGRGAEYVHRALALLSEAGVKIALDDFGTGYASLRHLKEFPVDLIKIDRSFVRDMETDPGDEAIVRAVLNLGRSLAIAVVAEGIERESQAKWLTEGGCNFGQGFLFSEARPGRDVPGLLAGPLGKTDGRKAPRLALISDRSATG